MESSACLRANFRDAITTYPAFFRFVKRLLSQSVWYSLIALISYTFIAIHGMDRFTARAVAKEAIC